MRKLLAIICLSPILLAADTHYVRPPDTCTNTYAQYPFTSWETASTNIQWAINAAGADGTVLVSNGHYRLTNNIVVVEPIYLRSWNDGAFDPANTVLDGQGEKACMYLNHAGAVVAGFYFTGGNASGQVYTTYGGAICMMGGTLSNCIVAGNSAEHGGGMYVRAIGKYCAIVNCSISNNTAINGGGGICQNKGTIIIEGCTIASNTVTTGKGGGMTLDQGHFVVKNSVIRDNRITGSSEAYNGAGVALDSWSDNSLFADCLIENNHSASHGGGMYINQSTNGYVCVSNVTIRGNTASLRGGGVNIGYHASGITNQLIGCTVESNYTAYIGGGIYFGSGGVLIDRCIVRGNQSANDSGGVRNMSASPGNLGIVRNTLIVGNSASNNSGAGRLRYGAIIQNCTITSNRAPSHGGLYLDGVSSPPTTVSNVICRYNFAGANESNHSVNDGGVIANSCTYPIAGLTGEGNIDADPMFVDANNGNYHLQSGSPCINAGANQDWMAASMDLDGRPRLDRFTRIIDMGCYEHVFKGSLFYAK